MTEQLSLSQARLLALAGQGLTKSTKPASVLDTIDTMGVLQIDSVNVFECALDIAPAPPGTLALRAFVFEVTTG